MQFSPSESLKRKYGKKSCDTAKVGCASQCVYYKAVRPSVRKSVQEMIKMQIVCKPIQSKANDTDV